MSKYIQQADIGKGGSCHLFRHSVATLMLGHVSIGTTGIYTHVSIVKLKQIHDMTHPTMHKKPESGDEPAATEEGLLSTLDAEESEES